jgi:hypothetical protein
MKWKYISSLKTRITPKDFQMPQHSLDHSYSKRETSLTKFKNSKSVMILVVRLTSSPKLITSNYNNSTYFLTWSNILDIQSRVIQYRKGRHIKSTPTTKIPGWPHRIKQVTHFVCMWTEPMIIYVKHFT